ncbi:MULTISPECIES: hypothetical protein [Rhizobium]|uniref:hypothetical protein n=1 Tax=Rhizobium TaxID=379 RepID=UPI001FF37001|nr:MULTISPECIES: hypothetical protein [Rhizobium]
MGTKLMAAAEEGRRRAAVVACVDTLSTQAPSFYPKLGYIEFGRIGGYAEGRPIDRMVQEGVIRRLKRLVSGGFAPRVRRRNHP